MCDIYKSFIEWTNVLIIFLKNMSSKLKLLHLNSEKSFFVVKNKNYKLSMIQNNQQILLYRMFEQTREINFMLSITLKLLS